MHIKIVKDWINTFGSKEVKIRRCPFCREIKPIKTKNSGQWISLGNDQATLFGSSGAIGKTKNLCGHCYELVDYLINHSIKDMHKPSFPFLKANHFYCQRCGNGTDWGDIKYGTRHEGPTEVTQDCYFVENGQRIPLCNWCFRVVMRKRLIMGEMPHPYLTLLENTF